jgi:hypothetical protein
MQIGFKLTFTSVFFVACSLTAQITKYPPRPTHESLSKKVAEDKKKETKLQTNKSTYKSLDNEAFNKLFINLTSRGMWVDVPRNSIIYVPDGLKKHISEKPTGKYASWKKFLEQNRRILHELPVTHDQSYGRDKLSKELIDSYKRLNKIVVATYRKTPVTVAKKAYKDEKKTDKPTIYK